MSEEQLYKTQYEALLVQIKEVDRKNDELTATNSLAFRNNEALVKENLLLERELINLRWYDSSRKANNELLEKQVWVQGKELRKYELALNETERLMVKIARNFEFAMSRVSFKSEASQTEELERLRAENKKLQAELEESRMQRRDEYVVLCEKARVAIKAAKEERTIEMNTIGRALFDAQEKSKRLEAKAKEDACALVDANAKIAELKAKASEAEEVMKQLKTEMTDAIEKHAREQKVATAQKKHLGEQTKRANAQFKEIEKLQADLAKVKETLADRELECCDLRKSNTANVHSLDWKQKQHEKEKQRLYADMTVKREKHNKIKAEFEEFKKQSKEECERLQKECAIYKKNTSELCSILVPTESGELSAARVHQAILEAQDHSKMRDRIKELKDMLKHVMGEMGASALLDKYNELVDTSNKLSKSREHASTLAKRFHQENTVLRDRLKEIEEAQPAVARARAESLAFWNETEVRALDEGL